VLRRSLRKPWPERIRENNVARAVRCAAVRLAMTFRAGRVDRLPSSRRRAESGARRRSTRTRIGVRWHTGATDELAVARPGPGRTPNAALEVIRQHGATHTNAELAAMLNAAGLRTGKGKRFTAGGVARVRDANKIFGPRTVAVQDGEVSVKQAAADLGHPRRRRPQLAAPRPGPRPAPPQRTLVHPLGRRHPGDLPAEGRQLFPTHTDRTCSQARYWAGSARHLTLTLGEAPPWSVPATRPARGG